MTALVLLVVVLISVSRQCHGSQPLPCDNPLNAGKLFCNTSASIESRLNDLMATIPLEELPLFLSNHAGNASSIWMPSYQWWSEGLHGVAYSPGVNFSGRFPFATSFPQVCTTAASFNTSLFAAIGDVVGREGRAMNNYGHAGLTYWAPNINIYRDPRWGRGQETPGEDPLLTSRYAASFVRAMQNSTLDPTRLRVSGCCKHFLAYDMEDSDGFTRFDFNAVISEIDFVNTYLPSFESCVHRVGGAASGIMCSYNAENGVPSCANSKYIKETARKQWGFDGYVTSDCGAIGSVLYEHRYTTTKAETVNVTIGAGVNLDCGSMLSEELLSAVRSGAVDESAAFNAVRENLKVLMRTGYFDPSSEQPFKRLGPDDVDTSDARQLALEAAEQGIVLLNYNVSYLPWDRTHIRSVAILGHNADNGYNMQGNYYGQAPYLVTPREGLTRMNIDVGYLKVLENSTDMNTQYFDQACSMAQQFDTTLLVIGNDPLVEGEGHDRTSIAFPGNQNLLAQVVGNCAFAVGKLITVVAFSGGSLDYSEMQSNPGIGGIIWAGYPGQSGGSALANILFGVVSPSGRLPTTVYPATFVDSVAMTTMSMAANATTGAPGFTYRYYTGQYVYPFGWGLTYTNWTLIPLNAQSIVPRSAEEAQSMITARREETVRSEIQVGSLLVNITNTGSRASSFTLLYKITVYPPQPNTPVGGTLSDFKKVFLRPHESMVVALGVSAHAITFDESMTVAKGSVFHYEVNHGDITGEFAFV